MAERTTLPRDRSCPSSEHTCQPADSITLFFGGGNRIAMVTVAFTAPETHVTPPRLWEDFIRGWIAAAIPFMRT